MLVLSCKVYCSDSFRNPLEPQKTIFGFNNTEADDLFPQGVTLTYIIIPVHTFDAYANQPTLLNQSHIEKLVTDDFLPLLISQIPTKLNSKCFLKTSRRAKLISQAEKEMLAHLEKTLTLKQLAQNFC